MGWPIGLRSTPCWRADRRDSGEFVSRLPHTAGRSIEPRCCLQQTVNVVIARTCRAEQGVVMACSSIPELVNDLEAIDVDVSVISARFLKQQTALRRRHRPLGGDGRLSRAESAFGRDLGNQAGRDRCRPHPFVHTGALSRARRRQMVRQDGPGDEPARLDLSHLPRRLPRRQRNGRSALRLRAGRKRVRLCRAASGRIHRGRPRGGAPRGVHRAGVPSGRP